MSGIEAVGLALAFWPVVGALNDLYGAAKDGTASRWAMTIKVQERIFKECVLKLLQSDEDLSEKDRVGLVNGDKSFESLWKDAEFNSRLESRLDKEMCMLIKHEVSEISKMVSSLQKTLGEPKAEGSRRMISFRDVKLVLKKDEINKSVENLAYHNSALRKLLKSCSNTMYASKPAKAQPDARQTLQEEQQKRVNTQFFNGFHEVLCKSFRCNCAKGHQANLSISDTFVMFQAEGMTRHLSNFQLRNRSNTMESNMTVVEDVEEEDIMSELLRSTWSPARHGSQSVQPCEHPALLVKYSENRGVQNFTPIPDLCQWIHQVHLSPPNSPGTSELQGVLGGDGKRYTVRAPRQHLPMKIVSMEEWLTSCGAEGKKRRVRAELAMNLASTILQFYPTAWIEKTWTWRNFSVARDESASSASALAPSSLSSSSASSHTLVITQRFWSMDLPQHNSLAAPPPPSRFWRTFADHLDPMLVRLGFALIELALGKRLSEIRADKEREAGGQKKENGKDGKETDSSHDVDLADYYTAIEILDSNEIEDEVGVAYQRVLDACLHCRVISDDGLKLLTSRSGKFEADLKEFVVEPLRRHHSSTWGNMQISTY